MDVGVYPYPHGDPLLIDKIVNEFLSQGKFDKLRKECMSDADTKPAYQNLQQRVESTVTQFLKKQVWRPDLNKNQLRDSLRKHILESGFFDAGINRIVDQVVNPNVLATVFMPEVEEVVYNYLSIPRPNDKNHRRSENEKHRHSTNETNNKYRGNDNCDRDSRHRTDSNCFPMDQTDDTKPNDLFERVSPGALPDMEKSEESADEKTKKPEEIKTEVSEPDGAASSDANTESNQVKMEVPSDESQESLSRMGVERLQIHETESVPVPDSDDSVPLEINEKSLSDSRDSDDSIINQMSPISQGRLTPDLLEEIEPKIEEKVVEEKIEEKVVEEKIEKPEEKKPLTFIGRIPKIKREDSESSKSSKADLPKKDAKQGYSSDESDSSKSYGKSDSDERKSKEAKKREGTPQKEPKKHRDDSEKRKKHDDHHKSSRDKRKDDDKSRDSKDRKRDKSRDRHSSKKSSSSSSRERSSSRHKSSHRHKDSRSRDHDRKKKEEEKKKSKTTDDHGKERNKKEDRRSTDRDSNERERDKSTSSRSQGEERKRDKDQKTTDTRGDKTQKEEAQVENDSEVVTELEEVVIEMDGEWVSEDGIVIVNEDWITSEGIVIQESEEVEEEEEEALDFGELFRDGALTRVDFPEITDDFYVKFDSTGFKYFEEWEKKKLDCEEEFKEFVDEAESNLTLISDDDSDLEDEYNFEEENRKTIANLLKGVGNFRRTVMFDPNNSEFYRWTNNKFYQKFRKKRDKKSTERNESDGSVKENIHRESTAARSPDGEKENRERKTKALHLKLLNRYKKRALGQGKHRRRHKRGKEFEGIKEKNDNHSAGVMVTSYSASNELLYKTAVGETENRFLGTNLSGKIKATSKVNLVDGAERNLENGPTTPGMMCRDNAELCVGSLPESPDDECSQQNSEVKTREVSTKPRLQSDSSDSKLNSIKCTSLAQKYNLVLHLPPSPDSDDIHSSTNGITPKHTTNKHKRMYKSESENGCTPKKQKRNYSQKYDSQDLYKPRPVLNGTRKRGRERGSEPDILH